MMVSVRTEHLVTRKNEIYAYRGRVPIEFQMALGKNDFIASLKTRDLEAGLVRYADQHAKIHAELTALARKSLEKIGFERTKA